MCLNLKNKEINGKLEKVNMKINTTETKAMITYVVEGKDKKIIIHKDEIEQASRIVYLGGSNVKLLSGWPVPYLVV